jgi:membrane associated rhomboid family serine protease
MAPNAAMHRSNTTNTARHTHQIVQSSLSPTALAVPNGSSDALAAVMGAAAVLALKEADVNVERNDDVVRIVVVVNVVVHAFEDVIAIVAALWHAQSQSTTA